MEIFYEIKKYIKLLKKYGILFPFGDNVLIRLRNPDSYIAETVKIRTSNFSNIVIGKNVRINDYTTIFCISEGENSVESKLIIGDGTYIGEYQNIRASGGSIRIGRNCSISQHISMIASNHNISKGKGIQEQGWNRTKTGIIIEDGVWIGTNSVILPGVRIGKGCVIGAGSIVTKNIPAYAIAVGNPARIIKYRE